VAQNVRVNKNVQWVTEFECKNSVGRNENRARHHALKIYERTICLLFATRTVLY